jgi:signal transduction histidine kinase/HPt (histidine-containing phosphotransfer) domain-containing protein/ActR/RegA family two-component response regulator
MALNQSFSRLNRIVRVVAAAVGVMAGVGIPASFGLVAYYAKVANLEYRTGLAAERLAEYIYVQGKGWRFNENRIADMIAFTGIDGHQIVYDSADRRVTSLGEPVPGPTLRVASPIVSFGETVGKVEADVSLVPLFSQIGLLTILGFALGGAIFIGAHFIPQRALRAATAEHDEAQRNLRHQIEQTHVALMAAREATNAKSAFLAMMSHEIRTPMNAVMGLSSSLLEQRLAGEQRHLIETIYESSSGLLRLLNDILDFSKLDAGKIELEVIAFSPVAVLDHAVSIVAARAAEKGLSIRLALEPGLPPALIGDQARLQQVVLNLASNAIKFTDIGTVEIGARCLRQDAGAATIECWVRDTGIGIAPDHIGRLFSEFTQADTSINRRFGGTGLGLAISKRILELMHGTIRVASTPGAGTTFTFTVTLPIADAAALAEPHTSTHDGDCGKVLTRLAHPLRVLLAEDNGTNQLVFSKLVQGLSLTLTVAENGIKALEEAKANTFDIVFMDMRMPEMDGLEATRAIRALGGAWRDIPIVALTANAFPEDVKMCRDAGMDDFLSKPLRKKILMERMAVLLADHPLIRAAAGSHPVAAALELPLITPQPAHPELVPILDQAVFDELIGIMGPEDIRTMLGIFIAETSARLDLFRTLSCERSLVRIVDEAHTLKGAAGTAGLCQLKALAEMLEHSAAMLAPEDYSAFIDRLDTSFRTGRAAIDRALGAITVAV